VQFNVVKASVEHKNTTAGCFNDVFDGGLRDSVCAFKLFLVRCVKR